jgi:ribosomal-protein-alanine N-acetyltransferase
MPSRHATLPMRSFAPFPILETPRLLLRRTLPADADTFFLLRSDPEMSRLLPRVPFTRAEADQRLAEVDAAIDANEFIQWAIVLRETNQMVGTCCLFRWDKRHAHAEVGYELVPSLWGRGLVTEAVRAILAFGFDAMDLHRVEANVDPGNVGSMRVVEKCGFTREATSRENFRYQGAFRDTAFFGLLRREFRG